MKFNFKSLFPGKRTTAGNSTLLVESDTRAGGVDSFPAPQLPLADSITDNSIGARAAPEAEVNQQQLHDATVVKNMSNQTQSTSQTTVTTAQCPNDNVSVTNSKTNGTVSDQDAAEPEQVPSVIDTVYPLLPGRIQPLRHCSTSSDASGTAFEDSPNLLHSYDLIPLLEQTMLPRGGISVETEAVGRVQFGIPPETIKDSMRLGLSVPAVYIVPVERFCREMGPALGVNLAEFEFPAYFNYFVYKKRCTLVVDSEEAERNIRRVFAETLLGPAQFRMGEHSIEYEEEDFAPDFPRDMIPNFNKELKHFRIMPDGNELVIETLLNFQHFELPGESGSHEHLGVPPLLNEEDIIDSISPETPRVAEIPEEYEFEELKDEDEDDFAEEFEQSGRTPWTYSQARWIGDVSTVWPTNASEEDIICRKCKRVEIFKMPGGTEYILHDIDENNYITGKARFSGNVKVSESMGVDGFGGKSILDQKFANESIAADEMAVDYDSDSSEIADNFFNKNRLPPTFHPPSFGVTVLGNSHGFDKVGSTSGYVLWINGRGVMIDPPPYSSATLEREGIRPRTIVGIILTHCHADHDAGAFQKVLTGSPVVVITTPTIYKSFIRKYAALSALSPALLRHSHRHKPAIIGKPLRFQGATFHFTYTLHTIPCVGFKVEWRGRSMVFTGDHFNSPPAIDKLQESGVLSKARADDLRNLPLQETDLLLHEAGAPPIHTPLDVLLALPSRVKKRLYVVHTSALPEGCELRVAPTGTAGTIRLDKFDKLSTSANRSIFGSLYHLGERSTQTRSLEEDALFNSPWGNASNEYGAINDDVSDSQAADPHSMGSSFSNLSVASIHSKVRSNSLFGPDNSITPPLVALRPASSTDAWFILNLLSAVPFLSSLSYASTMEVLETARVDAYCKDDIIVSSARRNAVLCVVWEGTCVERETNSVKTRNGVGRTNAALVPSQAADSNRILGAVWYAGDWTGPIALQPEKCLSGDSPFVDSHDVVAMSSEGVKVITVEFSNLHAILKTGSALYRKYLERKDQKQMICTAPPLDTSKPLTAKQLLAEAIRTLNVLELLDCNSALRKLSAVQKRHLESLAEGPICFQNGERLWRAGAPVDKAFIVVSGTASFVPRRRNAGSVGLPPARTKIIPTSSRSQERHSGGSGDVLDNVEEIVKLSTITLGESMRLDAITAIRELGTKPINNVATNEEGDSASSLASADVIQPDPVVAWHGIPEGSSFEIKDSHDYLNLRRGLQKRAELLRGQSEGSITPAFLSADAHDIDLVGDDADAYLESRFVDLNNDPNQPATSKERRLSLARRRSSRARFANKVLGRLYNRRAFTGGLVFSRGHFLGDVSKMVAGLLSQDLEPAEPKSFNEYSDDSSVPKYGFGDKPEGESEFLSKSPSGSLGDMIIHEVKGNEHVVHSSTLTAGKEGCIVLVIPKGSLIPFLDEYPGLLLSLLGTQVVV